MLPEGDAGRLQPLRAFVNTLGTIVDSLDDQLQIVDTVADALAKLIADDSWLPDTMAEGSSQRYQQHLLYRDPHDRFSVVSFVWEAGQGTPIHNHQTWGLVGVLRGAEKSQSYRLDDTGKPVPIGGNELALPGEIEKLLPGNDIHRVWNALPDGKSISIHVYGADIGKVRRNTFSEDGNVREFISGYSSELDLHA